jgi:branched-chain amino acid transport system substrate-binding protein
VTVRPLPLLGCLVLMLGGGCARGSKEIMIGVATGRSSHPGVIMAAEEINAAGGVKGRKLQPHGMDWVVSDDFDARETIAWAQRFAAIDGLVAVIGHSDSSSTLATAAIYNQVGLPQIVTIATNPAITGIGSWTYRLCPSDAIQGPALARYAVEAWGKTRFAVYFVDDDFGRQLAALFQKEVVNLGGAVVASVPHHNLLLDSDRELLQRSLDSLAMQGFSRDTDALALFQRQEVAVWLLQAARELPIARAAVGGDPLADDVVAAAAAAGGYDLRVTLFWNPESAEAKDFVATYRSRFGHDPPYDVAFAYDAVYLIKAAIEAGGPTRSGVKRGLDSMISEARVVPGVAGRYLINTRHDAIRVVYVGQAQGDRFKPLTEIAAATQERP